MCTNVLRSFRGVTLVNKHDLSCAGGQVGVSWTADIELLEPLSFGILVEDHANIVLGHQYSYENYYWVPTDGQYVNFYEGKMPATGKLFRMKHHDHMALFTKSLLIAASAEELGLTAKPRDYFTGEPLDLKTSPCTRLGSRMKLERSSRATAIHEAMHEEAGGCDIFKFPTVVSLDDLGHRDLRAFETALREKVAQLPGGDSRIICELSDGLTTTHYRNAPGYEDFQWDRAGRSVCNDWEFETGTVFTSIVLHEFQPKAPGPWLPDTVPEILPMHNQWNMYYLSDDGASHYFFYPSLLESLPKKLRVVLYEMLLKQNWRVVTGPHSSLRSRVVASLMPWRRVTPIAALTIIAAFFIGNTAVVVGVIRRVCKRKGE